ncbi:TROVE domain-containing protein [Leptolyngbya cf. ectocarpi LEGE 11479]|uniref:TROVE domain-containing protein n=1 Tax=Leptolyngbya cf. ectocarpi LEGE 11479 TaxID=1828722 RepID=A0A928ZUG0_LEPEC|nr:TROVE domain-containing protein [Leptolyngbya ectocarpi]MBE9067675.1 TROVE domain-containing protein [Leptolyngbya cf. ectocarpi LEGE 11479]
MKTNYTFFTNANRTSQTQPIPGRQTDMVQGRSGGYQFKIDLWQQLRRCLLLGTAQGSFYANKHELTAEFATVVTQAVAADPARTAEAIVYASDGHAINNSAPLFALVLLSMGETPAAKQAFQEIFLKVVRTGSHFYEWLNYTRSLRGFGKLIRTCGQSWLTNPDAKALAYQLLKYQQRHGYSHRDALRLFHAKPASPDHQALYQWATQGWNTVPDTPPSETMSQIWWYERVKRDPSLTLDAIRQGRLTHEMIAPVGQMDRDAWQLLFEEMPLGALLRNLGSLTHLGVLKSHKSKNLKHLAARLQSKKLLRKARIHPIDILKALKTYQSGGSLGRSQKNWQPIPRVLDSLEIALERSFEVVKPTGKTFLHAVDVSGSMSYYTVSSVGLTCCEIATTLALATAKAERNYIIRGFATEFRDLKITARDSFSSALDKATSQNFGGTDAAAAYDWAIRHRIHVDVFCFWTDCESWAGKSHPSQRLADYRRRINPKAKAIYVALAPYKTSLVDPKDPYSWDFSGFDPAMPKAIQLIAAGA